MSSEWITVEEAARRIGVHDQTIRRWLRSGRLAGTLLSRRAGYRIPVEAVERVLREGLPDVEEGKASGPTEPAR